MKPGSVVLLVLMVSALAVCVYQMGRMSRDLPPVVMPEATVIHSVDTVHDTVPVPVEVIARNAERKRLPVWYATGDSLKPISAVPDWVFDGIPDSVEVAVPMETKIYTDDSTYRAVISGAWVSLDDIEVYRRRETVTITKPPDRRRWSIGPAVGFGWDGTRFRPYVGVTFGYSLIKL